MKLSEAVRVAAAHTRPTYTPTDPFVDLEPAVHAEAHSILARLSAIGAPLEVDPRIPMTVGTVLEGQLFRIAISTNPVTGGQSVVILGPNMLEWTKDTFLALIPDAPEAPEAPAPKLSALPPPKPTMEQLFSQQNHILMAILTELQIIRMATVKIEELPQEGGHA
jgi:hypothetical protein